MPAVFETPQSLCDFIGREIATTEWMEISQERIRKFAEVTEDEQWIHIDRERARKESPYSATIAHGFLTLSLMSRFAQEAIHIKSGVRMSVNYGLNRVRFPAPVPAGSKLRASFVLQSIKDLPEAIEAVFAVTLQTREGERPCCVAEWIIRYYS
ncbi:MAG TPA: MaoC family dehydratase [Terriglobales bacterium]|nr:MaoC family dehydratase [Terriglobales bacterium]